MQFYENECGHSGKAFVRYVLGRCRRIVVLSESWRAAISTIAKQQVVEVISNPVLPFGRRVKQASREKATLLFLGRIGRRKGIFVLFEALSMILKRHPGTRLICGGDGDLDAARRALVDLGLEDHVEMRGWIGESQRADLLGAATIYVLPSFAEGLPMSILEAMSAGLPVVSTMVGGIPEAITGGEEGLLVPPGDAPVLSEAICRLLDDSNMREAMSSRAVEKFDRYFTADAILPKVEAIYRELGVREREVV